MAITRESLKPLIIEALKSHNGKAFIIDVCKYVWDNYQSEIEASGNILYTWQYDIRWAAQVLRNNGILKAMHGSRKKPWELA